MSDLSTPEHCLIFIPFLLSLLIGLGQVRFTLGTGSDHYVHLHFINYCRRLGHRLYNEFPGLLNRTPLAYPIFLHWVLSFFGKKTVGHIALLLNVTVFQVLLVAFFGLENLGLAKERGHDIQLFFATCFMALTPQFYNPANARNCGVSARSLGFLLVFVVLSLTYFIGQSEHPLPLFIALTFFCYLIWGTSMFAQQTLLFFSLFFLVLFKNWILATGTLSGIVLLIALHPSYGPAYLRGLFEYWRVYSNVLASRFILVDRPSVWRDLLSDFWKKIPQGKRYALNYLLTNPVVLIAYANPLTLFSLYAFLSQDPLGQDPFIHYCLQVTVIGAISFIAISFRKTRFLGEPERYLEMSTPFAIIASTAFIWIQGGILGLIATLIYCIFVTGLQFKHFVIGTRAERFRMNKIFLADVQSVQERVNHESQGKQVKFISNSGQWTKHLLNPEWTYFYHYPVVFDVAGLDIREIMPEYPYLNSKAINYYITKFETNFFLWDKSGHFEFENNLTRAKAERLVDTPSFSLFKISWPSQT